MSKPWPKPYIPEYPGRSAGMGKFVGSTGHPMPGAHAGVLKPWPYSPATQIGVGIPMSVLKEKREIPFWERARLDALKAAWWESHRPFKPGETPIYDELKADRDRCGCLRMPND